MKIFLLLAISWLFLLPTFSQVKMTNSADTVAQSLTAYSTSPKQTFPFDVISIQVNYTKVSGAPNFYAIPQGSLDGVGYLDLSKDTLKGANVSPTQTYGWSFDKRRWNYYRVAITTNGTTQAVRQTVWLQGTTIPK